MSNIPPSALRLVSASAPGKLILCGEHAVVYGRPAIALPMQDVRAHAHIRTGAAGVGLTIDAPDLDNTAWQVESQPDHPLSELVLATLTHMGAAPDALRGLSIAVSSDIPIAGGMGSGAAVATAIVRVLAEYLGHMLAPDRVAALVYGSEQRYHGTPSGIDNTVIAYEQAIWFERELPPQEPEQPAIASYPADLRHRISATGRAPTTIIEPVEIAEPLTLIIGDTGIRSETRLPVGEVRRRWEADREEYDFLFNRVDYIVRQVRVALSSGDTTSLGLLLNDNQEALQEMGVSSPELEHLIEVARDAGALGAKLSGGGWGGAMIALADEPEADAVEAALRQAGAAHVRRTQVG
jgi:mevalonate kinase